MRDRDPLRRKTVLQVLPALVSGGVERGTVEIAEALRDAGMRALVVSSGGPMERDLARAGATHITLPLDSKNIFVMRRNARKLARLIKDEGVDLVHARSRAPAWSAYWATRRTDTPFVTTFHSPYGLGGPLKKLYNAVMGKGDRVIAISAFVENYIKQNYDVAADKITRIYRGVDIERFDHERVSAERVIQLAQRWRLPDGVPIVMLPGRLTRWKGQEVLLDAVSRIKDQHEFLCLLVGSDHGRKAYRQEIERKIETLGLTSHVALFDACQDMPAAYKLSDVVVSSSERPEGFGRIVCEAQAMGCPVVVTDHGGGPEQIIEGETGLTYPPGDAKALSEALVKTLSLTSTERETLSQRATIHARNHFSTALMCARTLQVYRALMDEKV